MLSKRFFLLSVCLLSLFCISPTSDLHGQSTLKRRHIDRKAIKLNLSEMALADIPISSRLGISYEFLLDKSYGIQIGMAYLGNPIAMWGNDSLKRVWRTNVYQRGYNFDLGFRHYFDDADESTYYISTFFSTSRLWIDCNSLPNVLLMKKDRVAIIFGYQKKWRSLYFDLSGGLGVKMQNWKIHLRQMPFENTRLSPDYASANIGWNFEFNKPSTSLAIPIQFLVGLRF